MSHQLPVRVYYEDTDLAGVVYYANYLRFYERGRSEALRDLGVDQTALKAAGLVFVVRRIEADYIAPARFEDMLDIVSEVTELKGASLTMTQEVRRGADVLNRAIVKLAVMSEAGRPMRIPADIREKLQQLQ